MKHERPELRGGDQFQVPGNNPVQGWHLHSRRPHQDYLGSGSNGKTGSGGATPSAMAKQDLSVQHHQQWPNRICRCNTISFAGKLKLYQSLVTSILLCGCETWTLLTFQNFSAYPTWTKRPTTGCGARLTPLWVHRNLFRQLSRNGNWHGSGLSHFMTASPNPAFRSPWRVGLSLIHI